MDLLVFWNLSWKQSWTFPSTADRWVTHPSLTSERESKLT